MEWGYQAGCDFITRSTSAAGCNAYAASRPRQALVCRANTYKASTPEWGCSYDARAVGTCSSTADTYLTDSCQLRTNSFSLYPKTCTDAGSWSAAESKKFVAVGGAVGVAGARCFSLDGGKACAKSGGAQVCTDSTFLCARAKCVGGVPQLVVGLAGGKQTQIACNAGKHAGLHE